MKLVQILDRLSSIEKILFYQNYDNIDHSNKEKASRLRKILVPAIKGLNQ